MDEIYTVLIPLSVLGRLKLIKSWWNNTYGIYLVFFTEVQCHAQENNAADRLIFYSGETLPFQCQAGYIAVPKNYIECLNSGEWSENPLCKSKFVVGFPLYQQQQSFGTLL